MLEKERNIKYIALRKEVFWQRHQLYQNLPINSKYLVLSQEVSEFCEAVAFKVLLGGLSAEEHVICQL